MNTTNTEALELPTAEEIRNAPYISGSNGPWHEQLRRFALWPVRFVLRPFTPKRPKWNPHLAFRKNLSPQVFAPLDGYCTLIYADEPCGPRYFFDTAEQQPCKTATPTSFNTRLEGCGACTCLFELPVDEGPLKIACDCCGWEMRDGYFWHPDETDYECGNAQRWHHDPEDSPGAIQPFTARTDAEAISYALDDEAKDFITGDWLAFKWALKRKKWRDARAYARGLFAPSMATVDALPYFSTRDRDDEYVALMRRVATFKPSFWRPFWRKLTRPRLWFARGPLPAISRGD